MSAWIAAALLAAAPAPACDPLPGAEALLASSKARFVIVGEHHGTREMPAAFADLACLASARAPVIVAVEQPVGAQAEIDAFLASDGGEAAKRAFLKSQIWHFQMKDGRSSEAVFRLFETLRRLHAAGRVEKAIAFQPNAFPSPEGYERLMAEAIAAAAPPGRRVLVLVGDAHAAMTPLTLAGETFGRMASFLPAGETLSLRAQGDAGSAWHCIETGCGPGPVAAEGPHRERGIRLDGDGLFSGTLQLGGPVTASPPQPCE